MPKLFAPKTTLVKRKLTIKLPSDVADRLDRLLADAQAAGNEATVEEAIASYLTRAVGQEEARMRPKPAQVPPNT